MDQPGGGPQLAASAAAAAAAALAHPLLALPQWQLPAYSQPGAPGMTYALGHLPALLGAPSPSAGYPGLLPLPQGLPALLGALHPNPTLPAALRGDAAGPGLPRSASASVLGRGAPGGGASCGLDPKAFDAAAAWRGADYGCLGLPGGGAFGGAGAVYGGLGPRSASASNLGAAALAGQMAWMPGAPAAPRPASLQNF